MDERGAGMDWWGGGLVGFSFPVKFGWCSVLGKNEKLIFGMVGVRFAAAPKNAF